MSDIWLIEDEQGATALRRAREVGVDPAEAERGAAEPPTGSLAIRLHDLQIHNNKKWFGGADVRVDVLVVQGNMLDENPASFYTPTTTKFIDVGDKSTLPLDESGLLAYYGTPKHFIDISIMVSRDTEDSDNLAALLQKVTTPEVSSATGAMIQLATGGAAIAVQNALAAAATLGGLAYQLVRSISGTTIGLYRGNRLERPQRFGLGRNPAGTGAYDRNDLSFWFEVIEA